MSSEYFTLLCHILNHICQTREIQLDVDHRLNLEIQWLEDVKVGFVGALCVRLLLIGVDVGEV